MKIQASRPARPFVDTRALDTGRLHTASPSSSQESSSLDSSMTVIDSPDRPRSARNGARPPTFDTPHLTLTHANDKPDATYDHNEHYKDVDLRWSEVVPPEAALTFGAVWDPEEGLVTFGSAELSASSTSEDNCNRTSTSPKDAYPDSRSQVLSVDFLNIGTSPNTAQDNLSMLYPYAQSRYALGLGDQSTPCLVPPTRRSSAGTGGYLDAFVRSQLQLQAKSQSQRPYQPQSLPQRKRDSGSDAHSQTTTKVDHEGRAPYQTHHHSSSNESGSSGRLNLSVFGFGLCRNARSEDGPQKATHSRASRYGFLRRTAKIEEKASHSDGEAETRLSKVLLYDPAMNISNATGLKSAGFRSVFSSSCWMRSAPMLGLGMGIDKPKTIGMVDGNGEAPNPDLGHTDTREGGTWLGYFDDSHGQELDLNLDLELRRDVGNLKSAFSWTTSSTSRYIDVAAAMREHESDSASSQSSYVSPTPPSSGAMPRNSVGNAQSSEPTLAGDADSEWLSVDPATPLPPLIAVDACVRQGGHRKLLKKPSKLNINSPVDPQAKFTKTPNTPPRRASAETQVQVCPQCHCRIEFTGSDHSDGSLESRPYDRPSRRARPSASPPSSFPSKRAGTEGNVKGKAIARSHSNAESKSNIGRPAVARSASSPASLPFPSKSTSRSSAGLASPEEVLARGSYNHEWPSASHSPIPRQSSPAPQKSTAAKPGQCHHMAGMYDVLRGVRSAMRPSPPIPVMPAASRHRAETPPPTSFRSPSAGRVSQPETRSSTPSPPSPSPSPASHSPPAPLASHPLSHKRSKTASEPQAGQPARTRMRTNSLHSLTDALPPLRKLLHARSFLRKGSGTNASDNPKATENGKEFEDRIWVRVDIKPKTKLATAKPKADCHVDSGVGVDVVIPHAIPSVIETNTALPIATY
ncbi:hypothetical protein DFH11DRAFT_1794649 [Phellopilus nigrolimitatus]|nr:hypothetical protein DFH11DRAFT_1794649 [Phellopilus nigrolimitatus]